MKKLLVLATLSLFIFALAINAQVRPTDVAVTEPAIKKTVLESFEVKYMGGLYGFSKSEHGTVKFDDINERLIFLGKDGNERFSLPYDTILVVFPSQKKVRSGAGRAIGAAPIPGAGIAGLFMKKKKNYLVLRFRDSQAKAEGTINFLVDTAEILTNSIYTIGEKAEMKPRGDAYLRSDDY
jgi:hypothetical protein